MQETFVLTPDIQLASGVYFNFTEPQQSHFTIEDIAHSLSHICRFTGHCDRFYSVAQHCVLVSYAVPPEWALHGLMHDAHEAMVGDVASPLKRLIPDYREIEKRCERAVLNRFGLSEMPSCIRQADLSLLGTERRDLMPKDITGRDYWDVLTGVELQPYKIHPVDSPTARHMFLARFNDLYKGPTE